MERCLLGVEQLVPSAIPRKSNPKWRTEKFQSGRNRWPVWRALLTIPLAGVCKNSRDSRGKLASCSPPRAIFCGVLFGEVQNHCSLFRIGYIWSQLTIVHHSERPCCLTNHAFLHTKQPLVKVIKNKTQQRFDSWPVWTLRDAVRSDKLLVFPEFIHMELQD